MSCQSCCAEPQQITIERVARCLIQQLILDGTLTRWIKSTTSTTPPSWRGKDIYLSAVKFDDASNMVTYTMSDGSQYTTDLSALQAGEIDRVLLHGTTLSFYLKGGNGLVGDIDVDLSSLVSALQTDRVIKGVSLDGQTLKVQYGSDSTPNMGELSVDLKDLTGARGDGDTITGSGIVTSPLSAPLSVRNVEKRGDNLVVTLTGGKEFSVALPSGGAGGRIKNFKRVNKKLVLVDNGGQTFNVDLAPLLQHLNTQGISVASATPNTTTGTELPTTLIGQTRTRLLATPDAFIETQIDGKAYLIPAYEKP